MNRDILVENEGEDREVGVQGCISEHKEAIIHWDCNEEEADREDSLDDRNNQASVNHELTHASRPLVAKTAMPEDQASKI